MKCLTPVERVNVFLRFKKDEITQRGFLTFPTGSGCIDGCSDGNVCHSDAGNRQGNCRNHRRNELGYKLSIFCPFCPNEEHNI